MKKRFISLLLCLSVCLSLLVLPAQASGYEQVSSDVLKNPDMAVALFELGLFKGRGVYSNGTPDFGLEYGAKRVEGLVMLIRLLGEEDEALAYEGTCPFTDVPDWACKYVAYAYDKGYTKGTSSTTFTPYGGLFGSDYATLVLRALGYDDAAGDFDYWYADDFAAKLGLVRYGELGGYVDRDACVKLSYTALGAKLKNSNLTLAEKLIRNGTLTEQAVLRSGVLSQGSALTDNEPVQIWTEEKSVHYVLTVIPDTTYAYDLTDFKEKLADMDAMGGSAYYPDEYEDIDLNREYTNYSSFENHTNAEVRQFVADYVRNFDPSYLFADEFPEAPADWRHDVEIWSTVDYDKKDGSIALGRAYWKENLNVLRFSAVVPEAPGNMRNLMRSWQVGTMSSAALKNYFDCWIAVGGIFKNFRITVQ